MTERRYNNDRILGFGDDHAPFQHKDTIPFLTAVKSEIDPDRVVHVGDMLDQYAFSRYGKDPSSLSANQELKKSRRYIGKLIDLFPEMLLCQSNHDSRLWERASAAGIPRGLLVPYLELIGASHGGWKLKRDFTLTTDSTREQIYFSHVRGANVVTVAQLVGTNAVQGHHHTKMGVMHIETPTKPLWGMQLGCLINDDTYAFAYNKQNMIRPILGCGVIIEGSPKVIKMRLKKSGRWDGKVTL